MDPEEQAISHAMLERDVKELSAKVDAMCKKIESLIAAWETAQGVVLFIKWAAKLGLAGGALWGLFKGTVSIWKP